MECNAIIQYNIAKIGPPLGHTELKSSIFLW